MKKVNEFINSNNNISLDLENDIVYNDPDIEKFINQNRLNDDFFKKNYKVFYDFYVIKSNPLIFNIKPYLELIDNNLDIKYEESDQTKALKESRKLKNRVKTEYISNGVLKASFKNIDNPNKIALATSLMDIADLAIDSKETKGLYIYGKTGIGKTYLMGSLYNYLKFKGKEPAIIFVPEFIRRLKSEISTGNYNDLIDQVREQEILIIDDLGSENSTEFVRDEILLPIINYRSDEKLLTFFTSNLGIKELSEFLANTKNEIDDTKATRILRRILDLADPVYLDE